MCIKHYRKKPLPVAVIQFTGENGREIIEWSNNKISEVEVNPYTFNTMLLIKTLEGTMQAQIGSYIVKGVEGEFWAVKPSIFEVTYEEVND